MAEKAEVLSETRHANIERNWQVEHVLIRDTGLRSICWEVSAGFRASAR
jgi:hypothetical protein